jgi:hypothetical protein
MATFIKLQDGDGKQILINADQIISAIPAGQDACRLALTNDEAVMVKVPFEGLTLLVNTQNT